MSLKNGDKVTNQDMAEGTSAFISTIFHALAELRKTAKDKQEEGLMILSMQLACLVMADYARFCHRDHPEDLAQAHRIVTLAMAKDTLLGSPLALRPSESAPRGEDA